MDKPANLKDKQALMLARVLNLSRSINCLVGLTDALPEGFVTVTGVKPSGQSAVGLLGVLAKMLLARKAIARDGRNRATGTRSCCSRW
jgi:hypothetical protein